MATMIAPRQEQHREPIQRQQLQPQQTNGPARSTNVGDGERLASLLGGGALALLGLTRGSLGGLGLALLGGAAAYRGASGHCHAFAALGINTAEKRGPRTSIPAGQGVKLEKSITIAKSPEELYQFWHNFENLPRFMPHLESVRNLDNNRSHWVAKGPLGKRVEWHAEVINDRPHEVIAWRSLDGSEVDTAGSVHFRPAPGGRGTEVKVVMKYDPPGGKVGAMMAWLFGQAPEQEVAEDLRRLKQILETGEVPTTKGQPSGRGREAWAQTGVFVLEHRLSRGLGWFSIGLGAAELCCPNLLGNLIGVGDSTHKAVLPLLGAREIATGVGILMNYRPAGWLWGRVAGDAIDLAYLASACFAPGSNPLQVTAAAAVVSAVTAVDLLASLELSRSPDEVSGFRPDGRGSTGMEPYGSTGRAAAEIVCAR